MRSKSLTSTSSLSFDTQRKQIYTRGLPHSQSGCPLGPLFEQFYGSRALEGCPGAFAWQQMRLASRPKDAYDNNSSAGSLPPRCVRQQVSPSMKPSILNQKSKPLLLSDDP